MTFEIITLYWVVFVLLVVSSVNIFVDGEPQVPCYFIFGDSLVDSGNNINLATEAKVNYSPYGIDFPQGRPTGRFCNGRTTVDFIAEKLGFEDYIPPFATAKGSEILRGVNYASGSAGIRDETGEQQGVRISLNKQLESHKTTISRINNMIGSNESANQYLQKCLYSVVIGSNDYINNYFLPQHYNTSKLYNISQYATVLADQFSEQLMTLYNLGARKVSLVGVGLIGCTPNATSLYGTKGSLCVDRMNLAATLFNAKLKLLVDKLNLQLNNANFICVNPLKFSIASSLSPAIIKINSSAVCCEVGGYGLCIPSKTPCNDRNAFLFWDSFHPTELVNRLTAERMFSNLDSTESFPMDIGRLVLL